MFKACPRLHSALLAPVLLLSAAALARAQEPPPEPGEVAQTQVAQTQATGQQDAQPQPTPAPQGQSRPAPLTAGEKIKRSFRVSFLAPTPYAIAALNGGIRQIGEDRLPHKDTGDELADWGSQSARVFATGTALRVFGEGFYPALFRQEPRYEPSPRKGVGRRTLYAVSRLFVTRDDDGNLEPNYSRFAGAATSSALANIWERSTPGHDRIGADATLRRFGMTFVSGAIGNVVFREFGPDLFGIFRR